MTNGNGTLSRVESRTGPDKTAHVIALRRALVGAPR